MAATKMSTEGVFQAVLLNYLVSQARAVEGSVNRALGALLGRDERLASEVFLSEPRINELEIVIDEHAIRLLRQGNLADADVRLIVATLKINNDLERMGDLAVNLAERAISLAAMGDVQTPAELEPMIAAVRAMISKCLGALIYQNVDLATQVLESDDAVDQYRDRVFEALPRRHRGKFFASRPEPPVRTGFAPSRTNRRPRHEHRRRRLVLGARTRGAPRPCKTVGSARRKRCGCRRVVTVFSHFTHP